MKYLLLIFILVNSCGTTKTQDKSIPFKVIVQASNGGNETQSFDVISNQNQLNNLNSLISQKSKKINFEEETIVYLSLGQRNSGGFNITVEKVIETNTEITVFYSTKGPKATDMVTMALTEPYCIVKFDNKDKKKILFEEIK